LAKIGTGEIIYDMRKKIQDIRSELKRLGDPLPSLPELIDSANLLRLNEYLSKTNHKQTELLSAYEQYSIALEDLLETVFGIQNELKDILKEQSSMITSKSKKSQKIKTKKTKKTKIKK